MKRFVLTTVVLLAVSATSWGRSIELDVHDKALGFNYINNESIIIKGMGVEAGLLLNESTKPLLHVGINVAGVNKSEQGIFDIAIGGRLYSWQESSSSFTAIALGGGVRFSPLVRVGLSAHLYVSPDITAFGDSSGMSDLMVRADYQVIPQAFVYLGFRKIGVSIAGSTIDLDKNTHIGLKLLF
ncbi:MAG: hypothetical protein GQ470_03570 [Gammaproteobacteria bacterium]|nr:hypothetical protein [Gammaproteobacteria bacterium]